eukprot:616316-Pelagomonas_calceolata.AAC.4
MVEERDQKVAAAIAAMPPPPPQRPVGRPRILPLIQALPAPKVIWMQLLPIKLPGREEDVSMRLHYSQQASASSLSAAAKAAEGDRQQRVWVKRELQGSARKEGGSLRASPFPKRKLWSKGEN